MTYVLRSRSGDAIVLDVGRWRVAPDPAEEMLLDCVTDPVLDVGCGPGRIPAALGARGRVSLGIDLSPAATAEAVSRGAAVLCRSVFEPLPGEGRWGTVLLLDGNIGIGGDPPALLARCRELVRADGMLVAEVAAPGARSGPRRVRVERDDERGPWFDWAVVGADAWTELAVAAGWRTERTLRLGRRWFAFGRAS